MNPVENYILKQEQPYQSIMMYLRSVLFKTLPNIEERFAYKIPFYYYNKKPLCYLNVLKGTSYVDVGFIEGVSLAVDFPELVNGSNRKRVRSVQVKNLEVFDENKFVALLITAASYNTI